MSILAVAHIFGGLFWFSRLPCPANSKHPDPTCNIITGTLVESCGLLCNMMNLASQCVCDMMCAALLS